MSKFKNFVTCHCHQGSLDTADKPEAFIEREIELGTGYTTVTDHGTLQNTRKVYDLARKKGLKPILGLEGYLRDDNCPILLGAGIQKDAAGTLKEYAKYFHVSMTALDQAAFEALTRVLSRVDLSRSEQHGSERKPLFTWADLEELGGYNITMTSSCLAGVVQRHLCDHSNPELALAYYERMRGLVRPGNWYVEVFPHVCDSYWQSAAFVTWADGTRERFPTTKQFRTEKHGQGRLEDLVKKWKQPFLDGLGPVVVARMDNRKWVDIEPRQLIKLEVSEGFIQNECRPWAEDGDLQRGCNEAVIHLAETYGDTILIADDSHFGTPNKKIVQDIRLMSGGGKWRFAGSYHRQDSEEAYRYFQAKLGIEQKRFEEWIENTYSFAHRFDNFKLETRKSLPTSFYPTDTFAHTMALVEKHGRMDWNNTAWVERLQAEVKLLHQNGTIDLLPYFFIDEEVCDAYNSRGELTGPGRGSAAGLLLTYLLGITHVEPLKYGLSMERFLTTSRIKSGKLPDIDQDLPHRDILVGANGDGQGGWLKERFGDCYAQISTDTSLKLSSSMRDVARSIIGYVPPDIEQYAKDVKRAPQGVEDHNFIFGYKKDGTDEWVQGSIETDEALKEYIAKYPEHWAIVQDCLGLTRQKSRHACLPAGELIQTKGEGLLDIIDCDGKGVYTGQGEKKRGSFSPWGQAKLLDQGEREVYEYVFDTGKVLRCTPDHLILTEQGWVEIQKAFDEGLEIVKPSTRVKQTRADAESYAVSREGELVAWGGRATALSTWRCKEGHVWHSPFTRMRSYEYWCRKCSHRSRFVRTKRYVPVERSAAKCLSTYRRYDQSHGFQTDLSAEDVVIAKGSPCYYCSREATGMERIDNAIGHTKVNCVPACLRCNWMRGRYVSHEVMVEVGALLRRIDP